MKDKETIVKELVINCRYLMLFAKQAPSPPSRIEIELQDFKHVIDEAIGEIMYFKVKPNDKTCNYL